MSYHHSVQVPFCHITLLYHLKMRITVNYSVSKTVSTTKSCILSWNCSESCYNHNFIWLHTAV